MNNVFILLFAFQLSVFAKGISQEVKKASYKNATLVEVFEDLKDQSGYGILYRMNDLSPDVRVNFYKENSTATEVLNEALKGTGLNFRVQDDVIVIYKDAVNAGVQNEKVVTGKVTDARGEPIPGANVILEGYNTGTITDSNGNFNLKVSENTGVIRVSFIGFKIEKVNYQLEVPVNIILTEDFADIGEVQIVAYGEQKKKLVSGSISSIKADALENVPSADIASMLQGRVAGLDIQNIGGAPGAAQVQTTIRGYNDLLRNEGVGSKPLWVVDGIPIEDLENSTSGTNFLSEIDPNMIESIEVLKDASAASLYGSRAGNGVILVTTKTGKKGRTRLTANVSYTHSYRQQSPPAYGGALQREYYEFINRNNTPAWYNNTTGEVGYAEGYYDAYEKAHGPDGYMFSDLIYDSFWGNGRSYTAIDSPVYQDSLNTFYNNATNWYDAYDQSGRVVNANMQASGGGETVLYNIGIGFYDEEGVVVNTGFTRGNLVSNFTVKPTEKLQLILRNNLSYNQVMANGVNNIGIIDPSLLNQTPYYPGPGTSFYKSKTDESFGQDMNNENFTIRTSLTFQYALNENLSFTSRNGFVLNYSNNHGFINTRHNPYKESTIMDYISINRNMLTENMLNYTRSFNDMHNLSVLAGVTYEELIAKTYATNVTGGSSDYVQWVVSNWPGWIDRGNATHSQIQSLMSVKTNRTDAITIGYIGRLNYDYLEKYLFSFSLRRDGSSKFGKAIPWGTFPAASVGWIVTEEGFMSGLSYVDFLKMRASYGVSGQTYKQAYLAYGSYQGGVTFNNKQTNNIVSMYNPDLSWERTSQWDVGFDADLFNYRLGLTFDYYLKETTDMIMPVITSGNHSAFEKVFRNSAGIRNSGVELTLKFDILREGEFNYGLTANVARNWNKLLETFDGRDYEDKIIGKPVLGLWGYEEVGIAQSYDDIPYWYDNLGVKRYLQAGSSKPMQPGDMIYEDQNGDNRINSDDLVYLGSSLPTLVGGFVHEVSYKNWDLSVLMNYSLGRKGFETIGLGGLSPRLLNMSQVLRVDPTGADFWTPENTNATLPSYYKTASPYNYGTFTTNDVANLDYFKIKTITLSYNFDKKMCESMGLGGLKAFFTADNVYSFHNLPRYIDPENINPHSNTYTFSNYPFPTKLTLGLTANF
ncbi:MULTISPECIES: SusC/RagA family TonB-linked outer membrane protein [unclassified Carboxylicivirga]|uniref:SusC/RagA family TonB-linked outer membrane protein n=1 Tax=Carboxylicivirga TaxID=1628153 RepID=UPI003D336D3E